MGDKAIEFFSAKLKDVLRLETRVLGLHVVAAGEVDVTGIKVEHQPVKGGATSEEWFDYVCDCTYGQLLGSQVTPIFFEPCLTLVYKPRTTAVRVVGRTVVE